MNRSKYRMKKIFQAAGVRTPCIINAIKRIISMVCMLDGRIATKSCGNASINMKDGGVDPFLPPADLRNDGLRCILNALFIRAHQVCRVGKVVYRQVASDVFLIDWEKVTYCKSARMGSVLCLSLPLL